MKKIIKKIINSCGYDLSRLSGPGRAPSAFSDMARLCSNVGEPVIFDIGAHHGQTAKEFRTWFPKAHIFCFEPFPDSYSELVKNTSDDIRIRCFNYGLSDSQGVFPFQSNRQSSTNSLLESDPSAQSVWGNNILTTDAVVELQFHPLDSVAPSLGIKQIDILKMDVQGAEYKVVQGAMRLCEQRLIGLVYSEIITQPTYLGQKRFDQALSFYYESGFDLWNIYNLSNTAAGQLRQVDALFCRASMPLVKT